MEDLNLMENVERVVGTSSGSLAGSLYAAGYSARQIKQELGVVSYYN